MSSPSSPVTHAREVELRERELCLNIAAREREREAEAALLLWAPFCRSEAALSVRTGCMGRGGGPRMLSLPPC